MNFFKQLFQTLLTLIVFLYLDLNLFIAPLTFWFVILKFLLYLSTCNLTISCWNYYRYKRFDIFFSHFHLKLRNFCFFTWFRPTYYCPFLYYYRFLDQYLLILLRLCLPNDFNLFLRTWLCKIFFHNILLNFCLNKTGFCLKRWH